MSYYYEYFIGYETEGKIYPLGPYDNLGYIKPAVIESHSFNSGLSEDFYYVQEHQISDELRKEFEYENWNNKKEIFVKYQYFDNLPKDNYIKTGYFLIKDVLAYEKNPELLLNGEIFYDNLTPAAYAAMLQNELAFGKKTVPEKDCEGNEFEFELHNASDYMYYAYPDILSKEYSIHILQEFLYALENQVNIGEIRYVVLETEG